MSQVSFILEVPFLSPKEAKVRIIYYVDQNLEGQIGIVRLNETIEDAETRLNCRDLVHIEEVKGKIISAIEGLISIDHTFEAEKNFVLLLQIMSRLPLNNWKIWEIFTNLSEVEKLFQEVHDVPAIRFSSKRDPTTREVHFDANILPDDKVQDETPLN